MIIKLINMQDQETNYTTQLQELFKVLPVACIKIDNGNIESVTCSLKFGITAPDSINVVLEPLDGNYMLLNDDLEDTGIYFIGTPSNLSNFLINIHINQYF